MSDNRLLKYSAFGQVTAESNSSFDFFAGYAGRERDEETGLIYNRARYLDPATGRFLSEDPLRFGAGDTNVSRYVENGSTNGTDPSGLDIGDRAANGGAALAGYPPAGTFGPRTAPFPFAAALSDPNVSGTIQSIGGGLQIFAGTTLAIGSGGLLSVLGGAIALKGTDNLQAGIRTITSGQHVNTVTYDAIKALTGDDTAARVGDVGLDLVLPSAASPFVMDEIAKVQRGFNVVKQQLAISRSGHALAYAGTGARAMAVPKYNPFHLVPGCRGCRPL